MAKFSTRMPFIPVVSDEDREHPDYYRLGLEYSDAEYEEFFRALGEAIGAWSMVEGALSTILYAALGDTDGRTVNDVFHSAPGSRARLDMVDAAVRASPHIEIDLEAWGHLARRIEKASGQRNDLAHHSTCFAWSAPPARRFFLTKLVKGKTKSRKHWAELNQMREAFLDLNTEIGKLVASLGRKPETPQPRAAG